MHTPLLPATDAVRRTVARRFVFIVFACLFADFVLLTIIIPYVPLLLGRAPPLGVGVYSTRMIGLLFAAKPLAQILSNPFAAMLVERVGSRPLLAASVVVMGASAIGFASGATYAELVGARAVQGVGSATTMTAGMALLCPGGGGYLARRSAT